jgi:poly(A) polymerase
MIKKLIQKLLGQKNGIWSKSAQLRTGPAPKTYSASALGINVHAIPTYAVKVTRSLQDAGYQAFIVGGAVRDLLLGQTPKDFDVATNATPEQVQAVFRRSRIIGRRFQIVHVGFGREIVEVSTFRALGAATGDESNTSEQQAEPHERGGAKLSRHERRGQPVAQTRAVDETGRLLRDNVFGTQQEDATRRDFSINALFYNPADQTVWDYHHGVADIQARRLRIIGDAATRYREDPVRLLRAARFAGKLGFTLDPATRAPIAECADLIANVPKARLFDEVLKIFFCGHAMAVIKQLRAEGLHHGLLPLLDTVLDSPEGERFIRLALDNTDARVQADKPTSPGFLFAALFWPQVKLLWDQRISQGAHLMPALFSAADEVLLAQTENLAIQRRFVADMKEIWALQPRFQKRQGRMPFRLLEHPRYRAGYDFMLLRAQAGELPQELADWWTTFAEVDGQERDQMVAELAKTGVSGGLGAGKKRRRRQPKATTPAEP